MHTLGDGVFSLYARPLGRQSLKTHCSHPKPIQQRQQILGESVKQGLKRAGVLRSSQELLRVPV